jgi:MATE family multidrug resistance protein
MSTAEPETQDVKSSGWREVLRLALPLILANSFLTLQIFIDRVMLAHYSSDALAASMAGAMVFWTLLTLPQSTAAYATTFVAQYYGAGRHERVGPAIWQALYFAAGAGLLFLFIVPLVPFILALGGHSETMQKREAEFLVPLIFSGLPALIVAAGTSFFTGRGQTRTVLLVNGVGLVVNAVLDYVLIFGNFGFPELGMAGAGWATTLGSLAAALLTLALLFRKEMRQRFATLSGWRFDRELFSRLMRFGLPSGVQWFMDGLVFTIFTFVIGRMGDAELAASSATITLNLLAILPVVGLGQAVSVLVGQRLGEDRPDLAERSTWSGFRIAWLYVTAVAAAYLLVPGWLVQVFHNGEDAALWARVESLTPELLRFVAFYCLFDSMNLVFSFALKGAGDTRFVTLVALALAWPLVVLPTVLAWQYDWGVQAAWAFASAYVVALGLVFLARFRTGKWKAMRVIEAASADTIQI